MCWVHSMYWRYNDDGHKHTVQWGRQTSSNKWYLFHSSVPGAVLDNFIDMVRHNNLHCTRKQWCKEVQKPKPHCWSKEVSKPEAMSPDFLDRALSTIRGSYPGDHELDGKKMFYMFIFTNFWELTLCSIINVDNHHASSSSTYSPTEITDIF